MEELGALNIVYDKSIFIKINMGWLTDNKDELWSYDVLDGVNYY